jgi:hypothetical protein
MMKIPISRIPISLKRLSNPPPIGEDPKAKSSTNINENALNPNMNTE